MTTITSQEAAQILGVHIKTLGVMRRLGQIKPINTPEIGYGYKYDLADEEALRDRRRQEAQNR